MGIRLHTQNHTVPLKLNHGSARASCSGSVKLLNLATGAIVTRDTFKIVPKTSAVIKIMNDMAALDGRFMTKTPMRIPDMIYNQSVDEANMPNFIPAQPPLRDIGPLALIPDNPTIFVPPVLADVPDPVREVDDVIQHVERGCVDAAPASLELVMQDNNLQLDIEQGMVEPEPEPEMEPVCCITTSELAEDATC
jgi:hypothetical protein